MKEFVEKTPTEDPCGECDSIEKRNSFLAQLYPELANSKEPPTLSLFQQVLEQFRQNSGKYKLLWKSAPDAIFIADAQTGLILEANQKAAELLGIPADQIIGMHQSHLHPADEREKYQALFKNGAQEQPPLEPEDCYVCDKNGRKIPVKIHNSVVNLGDRKVMLGIFRDISYQKKIMKKLKAEQQLLSTILNCSQDGIIVIDKNYNHLYINQAALEKVDITPGKDTGKTIYNTLGHLPEMMELWKGRIDEVFKTGKAMRVQDEGAITGHYVCSDAILSPVYFPGGEIYAVSIVVRDVTEQKLLEKDLTNSEKKYRELYKNARVALFQTRISDGMLLDCSHATARLLGYTDEGEYKKNFCVSKVYVDPAKRQQFVDALKKNKRVKDFQVQLNHKDGTPIWVALEAEIFPEKDCIEGVMVDITTTKVLSHTERTVLDYLMEGKSNKEIAFQLNRSVRTIEDHRARIMKKLEVDNIVDLTRKTTQYRTTPNHS